jgi:NADH dehydrogenase
VVIVGAGFAGLRAARALRNAPLDVTVLDRRNYHLFTPLLYEVASAGLAEGDIAQPVRAILRGARNIRVSLAHVRSIDLAARQVVADSRRISYDYLVVAPGSATTFYGVDRDGALEMKDLPDATAIRNRVLRSVERATTTTDAGERRALMAIVVVGGGPTGVELAGALAELKRHVLPRDFPDLDLSEARVILVEATGELLGLMPPRSRDQARRQLASLGVEIRLGAPVSAVSTGGVTLRDGERIDARTVIWVAGVRGNEIDWGEDVGADRTGRVPVLPTLQLRGHPNVFIAGDLALACGADGRPYPMMAPVAIAQGKHAALNIVRMTRGQPPRPFYYRSRGTMVTIGRRKAVAHVFGVQLSGTIAWVAWLGLHLLQLVGLRNRAIVLVNWIWNYVRYDRASRVVPGGQSPENDR